MAKEIRARFSKGVIEPLEELELEEGEELIILVKKAPVETATKDAFERAAGSWKDLLDTDALLRDFQESRKIRAPEVHL